MCSRPVGRIPLKTLLFFPSAPVANLFTSERIVRGESSLLFSALSLCTVRLCVEFFLFFVAQALLFTLSLPKGLCAQGRPNSTSASFRSKAQGRRMLRLIKSNLPSAGQLHLSNRTPSCFLNLRALHTLLHQRGRLSPQAVAHEIEFMGTVLSGRVECCFSRRQRKISQPWPASTDLNPRTSRKKTQSASASL